LSLNAHYGKYFRMPPYTSMGYRDEAGALINKSNGLKYISSKHFVGGFEYLFRRNAVFTIEGFHKIYDNYPVSVADSVSLSTKGADFGVIGNEEILSIGKGRSSGFEISNRTKISNKLNLIVSYTFVNSEFKDKNGQYVPTNWDSKHLFTLTASANLKKNWSVGAKWRYVGGLPYTPYDYELSSNKAAWDTQGTAFLDTDRINSERLNPFHQLDLRIDKRYFFDKWSLMAYLDIQNAYHYKSQSPDIVLREKDEMGNFILSEDGQNYQLKSIESESGTLLPTLGIMLEF